MFRKLKKYYLKKTGRWWSDYEIHTTGGQRRVVAICPWCDSPRMRRGGWENPYYRCIECSPKVKHPVWRVETIEVEDYIDKFL